MQKLENIFRLFFFLVFSTAGICAIALAALGGQWENLYELNAATRQTEQNNKKIEEIIKDHQILTAQIKADANILNRIAPVTLGIEPNEPNRPDTKLTVDTLLNAKAVLEPQPMPKNSGGQTPKWLERCTTNQNRRILFLSGAGLVIVSFACFGKKRPAQAKNK